MPSRPPLPTLLLALLLLLVPAARATATEEVRIGVLSHRGTENTLRMWGPTADYLSSVIPDHHFSVVPLDFARVDPAVERGEVDFILVNPGIYVNLEVRYRVSRIATLNNLIGEQSYNTFGGVVFTRRDLADITTLAQTRGHSFVAVDETSLGGFQMAWRELKQAGINPAKDFSSLSFAGTHDAVVFAVLRGEAEVGTVRTNILERMAGEGKIDLADFHIVAPQKSDAFPFLHSTPLYPEWPFSKVQHTSNRLAQQVAVALLQMPADHPAGVAGHYAGWTIPLDYQPVHELFRELELPPYEGLKRFTLLDVIKKYLYWLLIGGGFLLVMAFMTSWVIRLNRELRKAQFCLERQYELILNSVADGIYGVDLAGNATFINRAMERITGWSGGEVLGQNLHDLLHHTRSDGSHFPGRECPVYATCTDGTPRFVSDDIFWKKDGSSFPVDYASSPIRDAGGNVVGGVVVFRDIGVRKQADEADRRHRHELAHVARLNTMGEMASGIAHELNQPLTAIATNAHACIRLLDSGTEQRERITDIVEKIGIQAARAAEIIRQLRQFVRKEEPLHKPIDLNEVVNGVVLLLTPEAREAGVKITLELQRRIPQVLASQIQIDQVILNLARNAIEAMAEGGGSKRILTIRTATAGANAVIVTVADTGPGLSGEVREQLFNPFVTTKAKGMGLGLSISMGIIDSHNGKLYLDSEAGMGAVFRFTLPVNPSGKQEDLSHEP